MTNYSVEQYAQALFETTRDATEDEQKKILDRFVKILDERNGRPLLKAIIDHTEQLHAQQNHVETVRIVTPHKIDSREEKELKKHFPAKHHVFENNPKLIGGLVVQKNDTVFYASLQNTLSELRTALIH